MSSIDKNDFGAIEDWLNYLITESLSKERAEYIIKACNMHEELVDMLEKTERMVSQNILLANLYQDDTDDAGKWVNDLRELLIKAKVWKMTDYDKPVGRRDGGKVVIWTTQAKGGAYPVRGEYEANGKWFSARWTIEGEYRADRRPHPLDLINPPEEIEGWVNLDDTPFLNGINSAAQVWANKPLADKMANPSRIACIKVKFKEGEGL